MTADRSSNRAGRERQSLLVASVLLIQAVAAVFFVADAVSDLARGGGSPHVVIEAVIAFALVAGVLLGAAYLRRLLGEARRREGALAVARGALAEHIAVRFEEWQLTPAECDVALFAIKGSDPAEIARLRGAAAGTVRAQLSQVYAKAGVASQAGLVSLFLDDLL